jgi:L,D-peptidoglycan transpeptidase YkuD (ErfK/YbiS/YcfS/YnhG family)
LDLIVQSGEATWNGRTLRCAMGIGGVSVAKREGDGVTPVGAWPMRALLFRPDRLARTPLTGLPIRGIRPEDGWCDDPADQFYNKPVKLPFRAHAEHLWRTDAIYDLIVPLGYNDNPPVAGKGSAIFLHVARPEFSPTEGCVAIASDDFLALLAEANSGSLVVIEAPRRAGYKFYSATPSV